MLVLIAKVTTPGPGLSRGLSEGGRGADAAVLAANGHDTVMRRSFSWLAALGLGFSITNSWVGYLSCFGQNLNYVGPAAVIFGLLAAFFCQGFVSLGLAELASAFPSSGGQYHFVYVLSTEKTKRFAAYIVGWTSVLAWWTVTCSGLSLAAITISGIANFWHPEWTPTSWQTYLIYVAFFPCSSHFLSIIGCVMFLITTCVMHEETQPASYLTQPRLGVSGWSTSAAWLLAISNGMYAYGGTDGAIHISEEIINPGRRVPQVMIATMTLGLGTTLPLFIPLMLFSTDLDAVRSSPLPSIELVYQATGSKAVTTFLMVWLWLVYMGSLPAQWVTAGRIAWAFARDHGTPFPQFFTHISPRLHFPVRSTLAAFTFACLYGLLYLASTTAFNSIMTSAVLFLNLSYAIPQGILLVRGRARMLPTRYLSLGWFGTFCNAFAVVWTAVLTVITCFPPSLPVTVAAMNYTSVVLVGMILIVLGLWFAVGRKKFTGPKISWEMLEEANRLARSKRD
ncbi:hypothetical protein M409DRAFT_65312 [Zasmidium cellare ATCC 36951]|uniref:Amino acid permease/ SLC12A domain-containing protein n=1 Tax=Zasmidium cellare ATCC 36951 TaxID=1080233 RepID=A0A6A6CT20_ZASCE|nr:uncharacterized protein M409DRAFT_65312 [Zasmidium cellare ATCC 36951]KAF2168982.1 hypothetical protein M409DRAFT_65312 [Zasmidium cellare ATCC 36951]